VYFIIYINWIFFNKFKIFFNPKRTCCNQ